MVPELERRSDGSSFNARDLPLSAHKAMHKFEVALGTSSPGTN
jgi:hypothetical protein